MVISAKCSLRVDMCAQIFSISRKDIRFLKVTYKIGALLAINPLYNFKKNKIECPNFSKTYGFVIIGILAVLSGHVFILHGLFENKDKNNNKYHTIPHAILNGLNSTLLFTSSVLIIFVNCIKHSQWITMNKNFQCIDLKLNNRNKCDQIFNNANVHLIILTMLFFSFYCYLTMVVYQMFPEMIQTLYLWLHEVFYIFEYFVTILSVNLIMALKLRYEDLNKLLDLEFFEAHASKTVGVNYFRQIAQLSRILFNNVGIFNDIFGWSLLILIARIVVQLLLSLDLMMLDLKNDLQNNSMTISNGLLVGYMAVRNSTL